MNSPMSAVSSPRPKYRLLRWTEHKQGVGDSYREERTIWKVTKTRNGLTDWLIDWLICLSLWGKRRGNIMNQEKESVGFVNIASPSPFLFFPFMSYNDWYYQPFSSFSTASPLLLLPLSIYHSRVPPPPVLLSFLLNTTNCGVLSLCFGLPGDFLPLIPSSPLSWLYDGFMLRTLTLASEWQTNHSIRKDISPLYLYYIHYSFFP